MAEKAKISLVRRRSIRRKGSRKFLFVSASKNCHSLIRCRECGHILQVRCPTCAKAGTRIELYEDWLARD